MSTFPPKKLAVYYGWPSAVNGAGGVVATAAAEFAQYDSVIFGAGLEDPGHGDHANTVAIIADPQMASTEVFGYIDATLSLDDIQDKIDAWHSMGVNGIFFDQFGYDFNVSRENQRAMVWCVHCKSLKAFVNAWNVDDVFSDAVDATHNPDGKSTRLTSGDIYLAESWQIVNGAYDTNVSAWETKANKMISARDTHGVELACVTTYDASAYDQAKWDYAYYSAALYGLDYAGFGEELFSASSALLPYRPRKDILGTKRIGSILSSSNDREVQLNVGISVNTSTHAVDQLLSLV